MNPLAVSKPKSRKLSIVEQFSGPIPPPNILKGYEDVLPGSAHRIISMAERQSKHRQGIESSVISSNILNEKRGMSFALIINIAVILGAVYLIAIGKELTGFITLAANILLNQYNLSQQKKQEPTAKEKK
ncbi:DUF2335 domain-containing protein [Candidatus Woesebacteria bacterium]|nr:DUF2335 domain-containing protein [Candidatus Woesebacteria bacterium]